MMIAQHHQAAQRRTGHHAFLPRPQQAYVRDVEPVDILGRINRVDHQILVQMFGQRQLHQNPVDLGIGVQLLDQRQQFRFGRLHVQLVLDRFHANLDGHLALGADIDLAGRVLSHQHNRQTRRNPVICFQTRHMGGNLPPHPRRKFLTVDYCRSHSPGSLFFILPIYSWPSGQRARQEPVPCLALS